MECNAKLLQKLFAVVLFLSIYVLAWSMFSGTFPEKELAQGDSPARKLIAERVKNLELMAQKRRSSSSSFYEEIDLNYVSRRRIPTGPDPMHNRRVVMRVPPGL